MAAGKVEGQHILVYFDPDKLSINNQREFQALSTIEWRRATWFLVSEVFLFGLPDCSPRSLVAGCPILESSVDSNAAHSIQRVPGLPLAADKLFAEGSSVPAGIVAFSAAPAGMRASLP